MLCRAFCHGGGGGDLEVGGVGGGRDTSYYYCRGGLINLIQYCMSTELGYLCTNMLMVGISRKISTFVH